MCSVRWVVVEFPAGVAGHFTVRAFNEERWHAA
jgi:hypothetical protein